MRQYVARYVAQPDVDDVTQRVFFELWRSAERYDPNRSLRAWLLGIARKRAIDQLRRSPPTGVVHLSLDVIDEERGMTGIDGRETVDRIAAAAAVAAALALIPKPQSEVLRLAYFDGYTRTEIATLLAIPLGTVKTRASRGLRSLARLLGDATRTQTDNR